MTNSAPLSPSTDFAGDYDVVVVGANPGGIACALRAAREGLRALLVESTEHVGGMWASGVQVFDTRYGGHRCPVLSDFVARLDDYYGRAYGQGSREQAMARFGDPSRHGERPRFEPHVAEKILREMLRERAGLRVALGYRPVAVAKNGRSLRAASFQSAIGGAGVVRVRAKVFVDATYEADLAALAGAEFRWGREGRDDFDEPHAGVHFTTIEPVGEEARAAARRLKLHFFNRSSRRVFAGSSGHADGAVQAYTVRLVITDRAENRRAIEMPQGYSRDRYVGMLDRGSGAHARAYRLSSHYLHGALEDMRFFHNVQNAKMDWLGANLVGGNHEYPMAGLARRREIYQAHVDHALGMLYFLQNDPQVPASLREHTREWGLARDEYTANDNIPHLMYVREARRLAGLRVFTEHDATRHPGHGRAPIHADSIAFAEWPMDSHDCNPLREPGSFNDGEFILADSTLPSQVPYRVMLTEAADNLLVPVCLSATHVGWGTLRLETVFVHTGEAAGVAAALCVKDGVTAHELSAAALQWELLRRRIALTYFADVDLGADDDWTRDVQYLGARGFFPGYEACRDRVVSPALLAAWQEILSRHLEGDCEPNEAAQEVAAVFGEEGDGGLTFREACRRWCEALRESDAIVRPM